jgi:hypothetical protein
LVFLLLLALGIGAGLVWAFAEGGQGGLSGLFGGGDDARVVGGQGEVVDLGAAGSAGGLVGGAPSGASREGSSAAPPEITWTAPTEGALVARAVTATVEASGTGLAHLKVSIDVTAGQVLAEQAAPVSDTTSLKVEFRFDPSGLTDRTHYLIATAKSSDDATVSVRRAVKIDLLAPTARVLSVSPAGGLYAGKYPYRLTMNVRATDAMSSSLRVVGEIRTLGGTALTRTILTRANGVTSTFTWDGKDSRGRARTAGTYRFVTRAVDGAGHVSRDAVTSVKLLSLTDIARRMSGTAAKSYAVRLAGYGIRKAGGAAEARAADYVAGRLAAFGYAPYRRRVPLKNGTASQNVIAVKKGSSASAPIIIVGAHMDSRADKRSPGGNDDASGIGVMLETARVMKPIPTSAEIWFVGFGAEEIYDGNPDHHHEGSRAMAYGLTSSQMARGVKMVNLDMVGVGSSMGIGTQGGAIETFARYHLATAAKVGYSAHFDAHGSGSDHEAFVKRRIPVAYYDWGPDGSYHTPADTAGRLQVGALTATGRTLVASLFRAAAR